MPEIPLDHLSDRELVILAVQGINDVKQQVKQINGRVNSLEGFRNRAIGAGGILTFIFAAVETLLHWKK